MDQLFWMQAVTAFVVGGMAIASISLIAERVPRSVAGVVLSMPSTMVVGLFFIGLVNSPQAVSQNMDGVPIALTGAVIYVMTYLIITNFLIPQHLPRWLNICLSLIGANLAWITIPLLLDRLGSPQIWMSVLICLGATALNQWIFNRLAQGINPPILSHQFKWSTLLSRAVLAGTVVSAAVIISKLLGPFWGVIVGSSFPAAYTSQLLILHLKHGAKNTLQLMRTIPTGTLGQVVYILAVAYLYPIYDIWLGTLYAYSVTLIFYIVLAKISHQKS